MDSIYTIADNGQISWQTNNVVEAINRAAELAADIVVQWSSVPDATADDVAEHLAANGCTLSHQMLLLVQERVGRGLLGG